MKKKDSKKVKGNRRGVALLSVGSKLIARVAATRLRSFCDGHLGHHQFGFRQGKGVDEASFLRTIRSHVRLRSTLRWWKRCLMLLWLTWNSAGT